MEKKCRWECYWFGDIQESSCVFCCTQAGETQLGTKMLALSQRKRWSFQGKTVVLKKYFL